MVKDSRFQLISKGGVELEGGGPVMTMRDSSFLLISNVLGRWCGAGERGPLIRMDDFLFLLISNVYIRNGESNCFSWWNCGLFQDIVGSNM